MRKVISSLLLFIVLTPSVFCQEMIYPSIELTGSGDVAGYGTLVHLKAVVDKTKIPSNMSASSYQWMVFKDGKLVEKTRMEGGKEVNNYIVWPDTSQLFFATGVEKAKITVVLHVSCLFETKEQVSAVDSAGKPIEGAKVVNSHNDVISDVVTGYKISSPAPIIKEIVVGDGAPTPPPDDVVPPKPPVPVPPKPEPEPDVDPTFPAGKFGLSKISYDLVKKDVPATSRGKSKDLAASFLSVAEEISKSAAKKAAGVALTSEDLKLDVQSIMTAILESNGRALAGESSNWMAWGESYRTVIYELYENGKIYSIKDWETAFRETALGLEKIK